MYLFYSQNLKYIIVKTKYKKKRILRSINYCQVTDKIFRRSFLKMRVTLNNIIQRIYNPLFKNRYSIRLKELQFSSSVISNVTFFQSRYLFCFLEAIQYPLFLNFFKQFYWYPQVMVFSFLRKSHKKLRFSFSLLYLILNVLVKNFTLLFHFSARCSTFIIFFTLI